MSEFISWCNLNQGFLSFVLSLMTIILSVVAIVISIKIGKMPYERKLRIIPEPYKVKGKMMLDIIIINCGHVETGIEHIAIMDNSNLVLGMYTGSNIYVKPEEMAKCSIEIFDRQEYIEENMIDLNKKIVISVYDISKKKYIFRNGFPIG